MDRDRLERAVRELLAGLGIEAEGPDLERTPERVARAWSEDLVAGYDIDPAEQLTWTPVEAGLGPVLVRRVRFASICIHHLLPFFGTAHVAYLPGTRLAGLSKIGRVVEAHAKRLQTQERLTAAIVETFTRVLEPRGVLVLLDAQHTCMTLRGIRKEESRMTTLAAGGVYREDPALRAEVTALLRERDAG